MRVLVVSLLGFLAMELSGFAAAPSLPILAYAEGGPSTTDSIHARLASFQQVAFDAYAVNAKGEVRGGADSTNLAFLRDKKVPTYATVSNFASGDFSPSVAHALLATPAATETFFSAMLKVLKDGGYTGLNLDLENIAPADRVAWTAFVQESARRVHAAGLQLVISVPAKQKDDPDDTWTGAFDFKALGEAADVVQLMTYDENGSWGDPGPVAGLDWVKECLTYALTVVPAGKISLGVPAFGFDWDLNDKTRNRQVEWKAIEALLDKTHATVRVDAASASCWFIYTLNGHAHIVWYDGPQTLPLKAKLAVENKLGGLSVYALGMEDDAFWTALRSGL